MKSRKPILIVALAGAFGGVIATLPKVLPILRPYIDPALREHPGFFTACVAAWAIMGIYWDAAAKGAAPKAAESQGSRRVHLVAVNTALLLEVLPMRGIGRFVPLTLLQLWSGLAVLVAGLAVAVWSRRCLGSNWSDIIAVNRDQQLVQSGPYRWVRHPYTRDCSRCTPARRW